MGGLATLINDSKAEPRRVLRVLQTMYDRFDRLADTFQVQKVRKTANEYYLVAAGLPDWLVRGIESLIKAANAMADIVAAIQDGEPWEAVVFLAEAAGAPPWAVP